MLEATASEAATTLTTIIKEKIMTSVMIWGPPGIGKSSIVHSIAKRNGMNTVDIRLCQLAPTDLRGLPFIDESGVSRFAPPSFLPVEGKGILFLDEINLASQAIQNVAMQLVLDRKVGDYTLPDGWFVIAAGNRVEDRAAVSQMPAPLTNRFLHLTLRADLNAWKDYAIGAEVSEKIISFLNFRPDLLHSFNKNAIAWPSPRTWDYASRLLSVGLGIASAVGDSAAAEFNSFSILYNTLPDVSCILSGQMNIPVPKEPSLMFAVTGALASRAETPQEFLNGMTWIIRSATEDYCAVYMQDSVTRMQKLGIYSQFIKLVTVNQEIKAFMAKFSRF
jgi:hypothetical protein